MKHLHYVTAVAVAILFSACGAVVSSSLSTNYGPLNYKEEVTVIPVSESIPEGAEVLGTLKVKDSGITVKCDYETVIEKAVIEARKSGGNAIKITKHSAPSLWSSCHQIEAVILFLENKAEHLSTR